VRLEILLAVWQQPADVSSLAKRLGLEQSHISRYLHDFERAGIVEHERIGHRHVFHAGPRVQFAYEGPHLVLRFQGDDTAGVHLLVPPDLAAELMNGSLPEVILRK
jgi:predicted transcriptional regulator